MKTRSTICMRCGYPQEVPEFFWRDFRDKIRTCRMCRSPEENEARARGFAAWRKRNGMPAK